MWSIIPSLDALLQALAVAFTEPSFQTHRDLFLGWIMCIGKRTEYRVFQTIHASSVVSRVEHHPFDRFYNFFSRSAWTVQSLAHQVAVTTRGQTDLEVFEPLGPGRPGWLPTQVPHRSGLAHHAHPVPHLMNSRPARSVVVTWTWFRSRCTCQMSHPDYPSSSGLYRGNWAA